MKTARQRALFNAIGDWTTDGRYSFYSSDLFHLLALILAYREECGTPPEQIMNESLRRQIDWVRGDWLDGMLSKDPTLDS